MSHGLPMRAQAAQTHGLHQRQRAGSAAWADSVRTWRCPQLVQDPVAWRVAGRAQRRQLARTVFGRARDEPLTGRIAKCPQIALHKNNAVARGLAELRTDQTQSLVLMHAFDEQGTTLLFRTQRRVRGRTVRLCSESRQLHQKMHLRKRVVSLLVDGPC